MIRFGRICQRFSPEACFFMQYQISCWPLNEFSKPEDLTVSSHSFLTQTGKRDFEIFSSTWLSKGKYWQHLSLTDCIITLATVSTKKQSKEFQQDLNDLVLVLGQIRENNRFCLCVWAGVRTLLLNMVNVSPNLKHVALRVNIGHCKPASSCFDSSADTQPLCVN